MKKLLLALLLSVMGMVSGSLADQAPLPPLFLSAAQTWGVPADITQAIARVESGGQTWALNIEGRPFIFDSKEKALKKAEEAASAGKSFDSGVMQVNNFWLKKYGIPLDAALDPEANILLGSWILSQEMQRRPGDTWGAVGAYHSPDPQRANQYAEKVKRALQQGPIKRKVTTRGTIAKKTEELPTKSLQLESPSQEKVEPPQQGVAVSQPGERGTLVVARRTDGKLTKQIEITAIPFVQRF